MVIVSGCGGAGAPSTDGTDGENNPAGQTPEQIEAQRVAKLLMDETTACGATCAGYAEWLTANPNLRTVPIESINEISDNNTGHYLQGTKTGLNTGDVEGAVVTTVTFNDAFDDVDDNPFDGFAYFGGDDDRENRRRYVGILSNTNMGAPLTTTVGRSIWKGFIASGEGIISGEDTFTTPTAFNLMVNFNTTGGTIAAFITTPLNRIAFRIDGEFDAGGVITGTTSRRTYHDNTDVTTYDASSLANTVGTLRGLIGMQGAVGVFTTDAMNARRPYAGGFVAQFAPLLPTSNHTLYARAFSPAPAVANLQTDSTETLEFAQPTAAGFSATGLRFEAENNTPCNNCFPNFIVRLDGDNTDTTDRNGFALIFGRFEGGSTARLRAGLLPGTDVGAPLGNVASDGAATANWPGTIYHLFQRSGTEPNVVLTPFSVVFNVDFAAGTLALADTTLSGENTSAHIIRVEGRFGSHAEAVDRATTPAALPAGVLGGKVYYKNGATAEVEHDLQGLIGAEGAVGVFRTLAEVFTFGGFVARNAPVLVNHDVYLARFSSLQTERSGTSEFVRGLANGLDTTNVNFETSGTCATACVDNYTARLGGNNADTTDPSGFSFFYGNGSATDPAASGIYRIGLLSGTDVGVALPVLAPDGMASAEWNGKVHTTLGASGGTITPQNLTLTVNYTNRMISGTNAISGGDLSVNGGYSPTGMIVGEVTYDPSSGSDSTYPLIGVIGTQGAIGIFEGTGNTPHVGGFIATPPSPCQVANNCPVDTTAWLRSFKGKDTLPTTPDIVTQAPTHKNQFLQATPTGFADGANTNIRATFGVQTEDIATETLTFANTNTATGGVAFFGGELYTDSGVSIGSFYYYAGILAGTNLGAPITETITSAKWTGQIRAVGRAGEAQINVADGADFELDITFNATRETKGTMKALFNTSGAGTAYSIDGTFDDKGIISGDIDFGTTTGEGASEIVDTNSTLYSPGTLSGIIGSSGAVGVFHSDNDNPAAAQLGPSFSGGFVVTPPTP